MRASALFVAFLWIAVGVLSPLRPARAGEVVADGFRKTYGDPAFARAARALADSSLQNFGAHRGELGAGRIPHPELRSPRLPETAYLVLSTVTLPGARESRAYLDVPVNGMEEELVEEIGVFALFGGEAPFRAWQVLWEGEAPLSARDAGFFSFMNRPEMWDFSGDALEAAAEALVREFPDWKPASSATGDETSLRSVWTLVHPRDGRKIALVRWQSEEAARLTIVFLPPTWAPLFP